MKIKNKFIILSLTVIAGFFFSCEDQLDLAPLSQIGENGFYSNADEVEGGVIAIYDGLQQVPLREFALTEMRSDNTETRTSEGDWAQFENLAVQPTNAAVGDYWEANYNVIFRANQVLRFLDIVEDQNARNQFEGEIKFARAMAHFNLVRAFGDVPLVDQVVLTTDEDYFDRDDVNAVLTFIETDLTAAVELLPTRANIAEGRATRGAAQALLAKVKLTIGDYVGAEAILNTLISDTDYALMDEYSDIFYNEMNDEIIFAIPYLDDNATESQDFSFEMTLGGRTSGINFITDDFLAAVDPADTERTTALYDPLVNKAVGKFLTSSSDVRLCGNDWIVLRLADVYLMHAEAIMAGAESTTSPQALTSYNTIRERVGLSTLADGETLTRDMLLNERRVELAFENHRFYDLIRFGVANDVLGDFATAQGFSFAPTDLLLPLPQGEINVSKGLLTQNPGY